MNNLIAKVKEKGLRKSIRMVSVKLKKQEKLDAGHLSLNKRTAVEKLFDREFDTILIFENHFGYYNIMLQRPQHITRELSDDRTLVLYNSYYDTDYKDSERITCIRENCYVLDMYYYRQAILNLLRNMEKKKFLMVYSTDTVPVRRITQYKEEGFRVLYEYVDDINPELISPKKLTMIMKRHEMLIRSEDTLTVATATKLYENVLDINKNAKVALISNGVECDKFSPDRKTRDADYLSWLREDCIKVGYYGALASWVDYNLLRRLADDKRIQVILIGVKHDRSLEESGLLAYENVRYFGKKQYDKLAGYANFFDVCVIPFVVNEITEATSPVKLFEYMSMGKPVVTTALPECRKYEIVEVAEDPEEFLCKVKEAAERVEDKDYIQRLRECAAENDWIAKAAKMKEFWLKGFTDEG